MILNLLIVSVLCASSFRGANAADNRTFPSNFKFGVATASYQVEGGWNEDGKGENIWDHICHTNPDFVAEQHNGDIACDSYHKYKEDVAMVKSLGVSFYRFSLSWSRLIPQGLAGTPVNQAGVDYYKNLINELISNDIEPLISIFHWDLPQPLQDIGGWPNPELVDHFEYFARVAFEQFGDVVKTWATFNEPKSICQLGYGEGSMAPGIASSGRDEYKCAHTLIKAHARAYHVYDEEFRPTQEGRIGIVIDSSWSEPFTDTPEDVEAAERALHFGFGWYANPIFNGDYPQIMIDRIEERSLQEGYSESRLPKFTTEEVAYIKGTYDFLGLNHYTTVYSQAVPQEPPIGVVSFWNDLNVNSWQDAEWEETASSWLRVVPWGMRKLLVWVKNNYNNPEIIITESGMSDRGTLQDDRRINYYREYLSNVLEAILDDDVDVTGYTAWSLMDNFEWARGYTEKFGLFHVDFEDPERTRTPKDSAAYYTQVAKNRCLVDNCQ